MSKVPPFTGARFFNGTLALIAGCSLNYLGDRLLGVRIELFSGMLDFNADPAISCGDLGRCYFRTGWEMAVLLPAINSEDDWVPRNLLSDWGPGWCEAHPLWDVGLICDRGNDLSGFRWGHG